MFSVKCHDQRSVRWSRGHSLQRRCHAGRRLRLILVTSVVAALTAHAAAAGPAPTAGMCSIAQPCFSSGIDSGCHPVPASIPAFKPPYPAASAACPQYADATCCDANANKQLRFNFFLMDAAFGSANRGCAACVENLKRFWCAVTCGPDQASYLHPLAVANVSDPMNGGRNTTVLRMLLDLDPESACDGLYTSCASTQAVRTFQPLQTCRSFYHYFGSLESIGRGELYDINWEATSNALSFPTQSCSHFTTPNNSTVQSCPCQTCAASCGMGDGE